VSVNSFGGWPAFGAAHVVATTSERVYPFGSLAALRDALRRPPRGKPQPFAGRRLRPYDEDSSG